MKKFFALFAVLFALTLPSFAQSSQFTPVTFNATATGTPVGGTAYPWQVDTLGLTVSGNKTTASWTILLQTSPTGIDTWTTCETITLTANSTTTATCSPQGGSYFRVSITSASGGGNVTGAVFGQNSKIGSIGGGGVPSVFGRTGAVTAQSGDYSSFYLGLGGGTITGPISYTATSASAYQWQTNPGSYNPGGYHGGSTPTFSLRDTTDGQNMLYFYWNGFQQLMGIPVEEGLQFNADGGGSIAYLTMRDSDGGNGVVRLGSNYQGLDGTLKLGNLIAGTSVASGTATWTHGAAAPTGACVSGSLYSNTSGASGSTFYVCVSTAWVNDK